MLRATPTERQHASHLRRILAENNIDYEKLKSAYENGAKEGLETVLKKEVIIFQTNLYFVFFFYIEVNV